jgi:tetratricopeptide (TPR) repeat protein
MPRGATTLLLLVLFSGLAEPASIAQEAPLRVGRVTLHNSGRPEAQADFGEGLAALHSFWYDAARSAFQRAQEKDPGFALAYWGEAMSHYRALWSGLSASSGRRHLDRLDKHARERLERSGTDEERALIAAARKLFGEGEGSGERAFSEELARAHARLPGSLEIAAFYALSLQGLTSNYVRRDEEDWRLIDRSAAVLEELFTRAPDHPGVLHYLIHAYDDPEHAKLGLPAARRYARVAPDASHAQHMPAHIFIQLGDWQSSVASNRRAWAASERWVEEQALPDSEKDFHALSWLHYSLLQLGDFERADEVLKIQRANHGSSTAEARYQARRLIESEDWTVDAGDTGIESRFARGYAAARSGRLELARKEASALADRGGSDAEISHLALEGMISHLEGDPEGALELLAEAADREDTTRIPSGPPDLVKPALELYGEVLLELGRCQEAARAFERSLARMPGRRLSSRGVRAARACSHEPS